MKSMKQRVFFGLFLTLGFSAWCQIVKIPDPAFKQRVIALGYDTNEDGQIQVSEAQQVTKLYVDNLGIVNMEGINSFTNLEELGCYQNKLAALDVSKLKKLKYLYAYDNRIQNLNINGLTKLEHLFIHNNVFITSVDFTKFPALTDIRCSDNRLTKLDVSGLNQLTHIECANNRLESVTVNKAPNLKHLNIKGNPIKDGTVDIRFLVYLEYFDAEGCNLVTLNLSGTVSLKTLYW